MDGVNITPGSGVLVAADDCGAAGQVQLVKLAVGADGDPSLLPSTVAYGLQADVRRQDHGRAAKTVSGVLTSSAAVIAPVAGKRLRVYAYSLICQDDTATLLQLRDGSAGGAELWRLWLKGAPYGANLAVTPPGWLLQTSVGQGLFVATSSGASVHYSLAYWEE